MLQLLFLIIFTVTNIYILFVEKLEEEYFYLISQRREILISDEYETKTILFIYCSFLAIGSCSSRDNDNNYLVVEPAKVYGNWRLESITIEGNGQKKVLMTNVSADLQFYLMAQMVGA